MAPTLIPKEVLLRILEHASDDGYAIGEPDVYLDDWYEDLCSYSLIARSWTGPAQALLWRTVTVASMSESRLFMRSGANGTYETRGLRIDEYVHNASLPVDLLRSCRRLE